MKNMENKNVQSLSDLFATTIESNAIRNVVQEDEVEKTQIDICGTDKQLVKEDESTKRSEKVYALKETADRGESKQNSVVSDENKKNEKTHHMDTINRQQDSSKMLNIDKKENDKIHVANSVDNAIGTVYKKVKSTIIQKNDTTSGKECKKRKEKKYKRGYTQDRIPIKSIRDGVIFTTSGMYVRILEILPINFIEKAIDEQNDIVNTFSTLFQEGPSKIHIKCITDKSNPERLISYIKGKCEEENWQRGISEKVVECAQDIINKINTISNKSALTKRYFFIYKYEGKSTDIDEILSEMDSIRQSIIMTFSNAGNPVVDYGVEKSSYETAEILYYCLNRKTCRNENLSQRIDRITTDTAIYNSVTQGKEKVIHDVDFIATKGLHFTSSDYVYEDGIYKTYFMLKENGHPSAAEPGWLDYFTSIGEGTELDIYIERLPRDITYAALDQTTRLRIISGNKKVNNPTKQKNIYNKAANTQYIVQKMDEGDDVYYVNIIITITAESIRELRKLKNIVEKQLNRQKRYVEDSYANTTAFYLMTLPLMENSIKIRKIMNRNKRNYTTSSLESLYTFTSLEFTDPTGTVLGENARNNNKSIVAINPYNTNFFPNANMSIFGMTGSGKTYSTQIIARATRLTGIRVFFILPIKAHEYKRGCDAIDGSYIKFGPGSKDRINICAIIPEQNIDKEILIETIDVEQPLLAKKIAFLLTWMQLNMLKEPMTNDECDIAEIELYKMYEDYGITTDNGSIYEEDGSLKIMPIIGDIYDRFMEIHELSRVCRTIKKYVYGSCSNMNGQTNVDLTNKYICFDVDKSTMPKELLPSFLYATVDCVYSLVKESRLYFDTIYMDEIWNLIQYPPAAEQVKEMVKVIRGYGGSIVPLTQDINDYIGNPYGKAILSGTAIKLIMYLEPPECRLVAKELGLTEKDVKTITSFSRGQAMLITSKYKMVINIIASNKEDIEFTTDPNKLKKIAEMESKSDILI